MTNADIREKLYTFFLSLKQPDGSYLVSEDSEVDIRGTYCLLVVAYLLNLLTPELIAGTAEFVASLQTYEGGFANASHAYFTSSPGTPVTLLPSPGPPLGEAHGGYTFCATASWVMLQPFFTAEKKPTIDVKTLTRWLTQMQGIALELGGFRGRTNKLVDACYSWWVGGAFNLLQAVGVQASPSVRVDSMQDQGREDDSWADVDGTLIPNRRNCIAHDCPSICRFFDEPYGSTGVCFIWSTTPSRWAARQASKVR